MSPDLEAIAGLDAEVRSELRGALGLAAGGLMEVIGTVAAFLGVLIVLVLVHELGHFIVAKRAGITVEEFGIGFPPRITSVTWHGTRYSLNWIPLGGFVKMLGEDGDVEVRRLREQGLTGPEIEDAMAGAFNRRPIWIRVTRAACRRGDELRAGRRRCSHGRLSLPIPIGHGPLTVISVQDGSPAEGKLEEGDVIVAADGQRFERSAELTEYVAGRAGFVVKLTVDRDGEETEVAIIPRSVSARGSRTGHRAGRIRLRARAAGRGAVDRHRTARRHRARDGGSVVAGDPDPRRALPMRSVACSG